MGAAGSTAPAGVGPATVESVAGRLRLALGRLSHALRPQNAAAGLTPTRIATLSILESAGPLRVGALADRIGISRPTMTRLVDCLAELGQVRRDPDPGDQRAIRVSIGPDGAALLTTVRHQCTGLLAERLAAFGTAELATLAAALPLLERLAEDGGDRRHSPLDGQD